MALASLEDVNVHLAEGKLEAEEGDGGQCMRRRRNQSDVQVFIHVSK